MPRTYRRKRPYTKKSTTTRRRYGKYKKKFSPYFKALRWSTLDGTNSCHLRIDGTATGLVPAASPSAMVFRLSDVAATSDYTALFDNYRVMSIQYRFVLRKDTSTTTVTPSVFPRIQWVHDFNDQIITTTGELRQCANLREAHFNDSYMMSKWYTLKPSVLPLTYTTAIASSTGPKWRVWLDTRNSSTVPHYGIKYQVDGLFTGAYILVECKYNLQFKGSS